MKQFSRILIFLFALIFAMPAFSVDAALDGTRKKELRGVWVAVVANIDYPTKAVTDSQVLKEEAVRILDNAQALGLNAVFLQVRPASDAIYKSKLFPWSKYLTGRQGLAPDNGFDPLGFWVAEAHKRGMELHAWINPYRITKKIPKEPKYDIASLAASNPARLKPEWVVKHSDGNLYYNPGIPEVRGMVKDGVLELIKNYDIDGIHLDDYFYPGKDFEDKAAYAKYGKGYSSKDDWRRANVNMLISDLSKAIKETREAVSFGVSPFGIWANKSANKLGSDTRGLQSYYDQYADTRKWVKDGLLDYIAPQIYWYIGYEIADYSKLLQWWTGVTEGTGVDLYIGQAAYKAGSTDTKSPWYSSSQIEQQLQLNSQNKEVKGSIFFSSKSLSNSPQLSNAIKKAYAEMGSPMGSSALTVSRPSEDITTGFESYYLNGASDPAKPLYLNGALVEKRSALGYFGVLVPLAQGSNIFTFTQEGFSATRIIHRKAASLGLSKMDKAEIIPSSVFPKSQESWNPGEKITLTCKAPYGSKVTVKLGGRSYVMKASGKSAPEGLYADTFTYEYTIPEYKGAPRNIDLGEPVYVMDYKGTTKSCKAAGKIGAIMKSSPFYAKVEKDIINTYSAPTSSDGAAAELYKGMADSATAISGGYVRLSLGQWVKAEDVSLASAKAQTSVRINSASYITGDWWDSLELKIKNPAAAIAGFDGRVLKLDVTAGYKAAQLQLPDSSPFSMAVIEKNGSNTGFILTLKEKQCISGYYVRKTTDGIVLYIRRPVRSNDGIMPLSGISIMLDPGHGGSDNGTTGPLGDGYPEKTINLNIALKLKSELEKQGARVLMTRTEDIKLSLEERLAASRNAKPDMFVSIHANSMEDNVDISKVDGFSVFYREELAKPLADMVFKNALNELNRTSKGLHRKNFYVTRGTWTPSILVESGFVPNPYEFEWLIGEQQQAELAQSLARSIIQYFR